MFDEMDPEAILTRRPAVVLIDELAHTNVEGSKHKKRYEDVLDILPANIDVLSTMNIQHLESATPTVASITGIQVREIVPDWRPGSICTGPQDNPNHFRQNRHSRLEAGPLQLLPPRQSAG
jgi:osmosensitive K+ channel His kinase sensor protein